MKNFALLIFKVYDAVKKIELDLSNNLNGLYAT
jgi:hypothetical protein